ncbi:hypothetical protein [Cytobacillus sp. Bac17]|uniref:hypothetical protein n=1 Tax=Cytobacillus sp. Bac17 TaxID=2926008 RepID=UPI00211962D4|nr:hypothetical protein [Cytobacillus sp. Bac17]
MSKELTIFELGVEPVEEKKVEEKKNTSASKGSAAVKAPVQPKEEIKVTAEWSIHFATEHFVVSDFVEEIPEEGITLEELRVELEKNYFQFTATRTKWDVDKENKRLFPDALGAAKGAF